MIPNVNVWCKHPDHSRYDHMFLNHWWGERACVEPYTMDAGPLPEGVRRERPFSDAPDGPTWADGVFSEDTPWPEVSP